MLDLLQPPLPVFDHEGTEVPSVQSGRRQPQRRPRPVIRLGPTAPTPITCEAAERRALRLAFLGLTARRALSGADVLTLLGEPLASEPERHERMGVLVGLNRSLLLICRSRTTRWATCAAPAPPSTASLPSSSCLPEGRRLSPECVLTLLRQPSLRRLSVPSLACSCRKVRGSIQGASSGGRE